MNRTNKTKYRFFAANLVKGLIWLGAIGIIFFLFKNYFNDWYSLLMGQIANKPILVISVFTFSEVFFGIIPPELFMIWALHQGTIANYILYTAVLGGISYVAGVLGYYLGYRFSHSDWYKKIPDQYGRQLKKNVKRFGGFMVFIAAVTPIPFSAICMVTGASRYHLVNFLLISITRLVRFAIYAYVIWGVDRL